jgi:hypothetical protein
MCLIDPIFCTVTTISTSEVGVCPFDFCPLWPHKLFCDSLFAAVGSLNFLWVFLRCYEIMRLPVGWPMRFHRSFKNRWFYVSLFVYHVFFMLSVYKACDVEIITRGLSSLTYHLNIFQFGNVPTWSTYT